MLSLCQHSLTGVLGESFPRLPACHGVLGLAMGLGEAWRLSFALCHCLVLTHGCDKLQAAASSLANEIYQIGRHGTLAISQRVVSSLGRLIPTLQRWHLYPMVKRTSLFPIALPGPAIAAAVVLDWLCEGAAAVRGLL